MLQAAGFNADTHVKETEKAIAGEGIAEEEPQITDENLTADRTTGEAAAQRSCSSKKLLENMLEKMMRR